MWHDPIVDDIHRVREAYAAKFNHDIAAMVRSDNAGCAELGDGCVVFRATLLTQSLNHLTAHEVRQPLRSLGIIKLYPDKV